MARLLALFVGVPLVELLLLIEIGQRIGTLPTIALIVVTGILGATLARQQGFRVLRQIQDEVAQGQVPTSAMVDGVIVLIAAAVLLTPGILTDAVGFACLVPAVRVRIRRLLRRRLERAVADADITIDVRKPDELP